MSFFRYAWSTPAMRHPNDVRQDAPIILKEKPRGWAVLDDDDERGRGDDRSDHEFVLRAKHRPILSLRCKSRAKVASHRPVWFDGDVIEGGVQLMLHKSTHVEAIVFRVRGRIAPPETGRPDIFWSTTQTLWIASSNGELLSPMEKLFKGHCLPVGNHHWPIALQLPHQVSVNTNSGRRSYPLPPSFRKSHPSALLEYEMMITAYRGILRESYTLIIPFVFLPRSSPAFPLGRPPPTLSVLLIQPPNHTSTFDSSHTASSSSTCCAPPLTLNPPDYSIELETHHLTLEGTVFSIRNVQVRCRVLYKAPLIYARGHPICVTIILESADSQALDLIADPEAISFALEQKVTVAGDQMWNDLLAKGCLEVSKEYTVLASPISPSAGMKTRTLEGVVHVPRETKPTFTFITFVVEHVLTLQFSPSFFTPAVGKTFPRVNQSIQIVTNRVLTP